MVDYPTTTSLAQNKIHEFDEQERPARLVLKAVSRKPKAYRNIHAASTHLQTGNDIEMAHLKPRATSNAESPREPQSPIFRQPEDSKPFPAFEDTSLSLHGEPPHCYQHCRHTVCRIMSEREKTNRVCVCVPVDPAALQSPRYNETSTFAPAANIPMPVILLGEDYASLPLEIDPDNGNEIISISEQDAKILAERYFNTVPTSQHYRELLHFIRPRARKLKLLFKMLMLQYIRRRSRQTQLQLTCTELRNALHVYMNSGLRDWRHHYPEDIDDEAMDADWRFYFDNAPFEHNGPGTVAWFMAQSLEDMEKLFLWRSREMKDYDDQVNARNELVEAEKAAKTLEAKEKKKQRWLEAEHERRAQGGDLLDIMAAAIFLFCMYKVWLLY